MPKSAYIHIPFCKSKCKYCSFISFNKLDFVEKYIDALIKEIERDYCGENLKTLYFGGGTPSLIQPDLLEKVLNLFKLEDGCEITLELNPDDASATYLKNIKNLGINRLRIGAQTFDDDILKLIGRRHTAKDILNAVYLAKKCDFNNISLDLIYGLPLQTIESLKKDLEVYLALDIQHISTYGLKIEQASSWGENPPNIPDDDTQADMYEIINYILEQNNYLRYEISNFSKKDYESKHNLNYWNNAEYYGFGVAAHGYVNKIRYSNTDDLKTYISNPWTKLETYSITKQKNLEEEIFLGFRKTKGLDIANINQKFEIDFENRYNEILNKYADYIEKTADGYALNIQGVLISNIILAEFLSE